MRILIVSYFAEAHLFSSSAQNVRNLASVLRDKGHEVRVVCAGAKEETIVQDGYSLTKIPIASPDWGRKRFNGWLPDPRVRAIAEHYLQSWRPEVIYLEAWKHLTDFASVGHERGIPIVQLLQDYSILCLRQWLVDSWGELCSGPTTPEKCSSCIWHGQGVKERARDTLLSLPLIGATISTHITGGDDKRNARTRSVVREAVSHMQRYREMVTRYIAQTPSVVEVLEANGVAPSRCHVVPQYIGEEKFQAFPRPIRDSRESRPVRFAFVGRWSWEKGVHLLLDAFRFARVEREVELWIISTTTSQAEIDVLMANSLRPDRRVRVFDDLRGADVSRTLALTDVCIVPSICMELASMVVLEANAQDIPVIASSTVGNRYVIEDGVNGKVFPSGDPNALRHWIEVIAKEPHIAAEWAQHVSSPIRREAWASMMLNVLAEAIRIGATVG